MKNTAFKKTVCRYFLPCLVQGLLFSALMFFSTSQSFSQQESSPSSISEEAIKESLKQRLEKAVKQQPVLTQKKAWVGILDSIANHTLTIETRDGPKLASISAQTTIIKLPKRTKIDIDDLEIGAHTIAMGYVNGKQVLDARRIILENKAPETDKRKVLFLTVTDINIRKNFLTASDNQGKSYLLNFEKNSIFVI